MYNQRGFIFYFIPHLSRWGKNAGFSPLRIPHLERCGNIVFRRIPHLERWGNKHLYFASPIAGLLNSLNVLRPHSRKASYALTSES
jgi:hypothetical protein